MKNDKLVKFGLSVLFAAVLSACGGSSNKNDNAGKPEVDPNEGKKPEVTEEAGDKLKLPTERYTNFQVAKNLQSAFGNNPVVTNDVYHGLSPAKLEPHNSLDTIVIGTPRAEVVLSAYLEDFQFTNDKDGTPFDFDSSYNETVTGLAGLVGAVFDKGTATKDEYIEFIKDKIDAVKEGLKKETENKLQNNPFENRELLLAQDKFVADLLSSLQKEVEKEFEAKKEKEYDNFNPKSLASDALKSLSKDKTEAEKAKTALGESAKSVEEALKASGEALSNLVLLSDRVAGQTKLTGIYVDEGTKYGAKRVGKEVTETDTVGSKDGKAFLYQQGRLIYFTDEKADVDPEAKVKNEYKASEIRNLKGSVAEVYGSKTYGYEVHNETPDYTIKNDGGANAPFINQDSKTKKYTHGGKLEYVQYGRVTSAIHDKTLDQFKKGVPKNTIVVSFGEYGDAGTENSYFSRGINHISNKDVANLPSGVLTYRGHAVSHGLDNSWDGNSSDAVPNAIGGAERIYSGNHVVANINTASKEVTGSVYNVWTDGKSYRDVNLVDFKGAFGENGNMEGTSMLAYPTKVDNKEGQFYAALYGSKGEELAGMVKSNTNDAENGWVAAFGAKRIVEAAAPAGTAWDPRNEYGTGSNQGGFKPATGSTGAADPNAGATGGAAAGAAGAADPNAGAAAGAAGAADPNAGAKPATNP